MALVTIQRSPSPSTEDDLDTAGSSEDAIDSRSALKRRSKSSREKLRKIFRSIHFISKLRPCLSDSYFTIKGAALILPNNEYSKKSSRKSHGGEIQEHLQAMLHLLRPEDKIKIAVRLEDVASSKFSRYMALVSTLGRQDTEEAVILGIDCCKGETANIRLVLPIWLGVKLRLGGDGGFSLNADQNAYMFNPVSVQAMWSAIQSLVKVMHVAEDMKYLQEGLTHTWVDYYRGRINQDLNRNSHWNVEGVEIFAPSSLSLGADENVSTKHAISTCLREVMMNVDLDEATSRSLRLAVEDRLKIDLKAFKSYFDEEVMRIVGQMDAPSEILEYLYLGSEWNASNLDELKDIGIGYILNITQEIDNFFSGMFHYFNVRLLDVEASDLLKHWDKTYKFISKARDHGSKVLVHCKMGVSRSASSVMAYLMKHNRWGVDEAYEFVKSRRSCVNPNNGFVEQLHMYEAILSASNKRHIFKNKSDPNLLEENSREESEQCQGFLLGDSLFHVMSKSDWSNGGGGRPPDKEEEWLQTNLHMDTGIVEMETDLETADSRSGDSVEEFHQDEAATSGTSSPAMPLEHQMSSDSMAGGLQSRIKPDSSWIKIETAAEMSEEASVATAAELVPMQEEEGDSRAAEGEPLSCHSSEVHSQSLTMSSNVVHTSQNSTWPEEDISQCTDTKMSLLSQSQSHDSFSGVNLLSKASVHQTDSSTSEHESMLTDEHDITTPPVLASEMPTSSSAAKGTFDQNENPLASAHLSEIDSVTTGISPPTLLTREEMPPELTPPPGPRNIEVGVREYFYREKIPWNPGKVQKIREGINRTGHLPGEESTKCETSLSHCDEELMALDCDGGMELMMTKEGDALQETECESISQGQSAATVLPDDESSAMDASAKSLYDKEDIPLEPGTVLRTKKEIEERHRSWCENSEVNQQKPVIRTSSLKHAKEAIPQSECVKRRVSCGPIIAQEQVKSQESFSSLNEESLAKIEDFTSEHTYYSATEEVEEPPIDTPTAEPKAVSMQVFGDDVTIESGLVKKHRMEIETKQDCRHKLNTAAETSDTEHSSPPVQRKSTPTLREHDVSPSPPHNQTEVLSRESRSLCQTELHSDCHHREDVPRQEDRLQKSNLDKGTLALIREIGSAFIMRPDSEETADEAMEQGDEDGTGNSNMVKYFVNKIEKQTGHTHANPPRTIVIVENQTDKDKPAVFPTVVSEHPLLESMKAETKLDLGFTPGESGTDDIASASSSKFQAHSAGDGSEPSVVRHLVDRFEIKSPDEDFGDGSTCKSIFHDSGNSSPQQHGSALEHAPHSPKNFHPSAGEKSDKFSHFSIHSKSTSPSSCSAELPASHLPPTSTSPLNPTTASLDTNLPYITPGMTKKPSTSPSATGDEDTHTLRPSSFSQRPRPKSADHVHDVQRLAETEGATYGARYFQSHHKSQESSDEGISGTALRQGSEETKIRKLHGKSHPLTKLASPPSSQQPPRGGPFHSSM